MKRRIAAWLTCMTVGHDKQRLDLPHVAWICRRCGRQFVEVWP